MRKGFMHMASIKIFQPDLRTLSVTHPTVALAFQQSVVADVAVKAVIADGAYHLAYVLESTLDGEAALEDAWMAAQEILRADTKPVFKSAEAKTSAKGDLYVLEGENGPVPAVLQGTWFSFFQGRVPEADYRFKREIAAA
jgi:hypothetical protein